jgi:hypothetical protein
MLENTFSEEGLERQRGHTPHRSMQGDILSFQRSWIEPWRLAADFHQVAQDFVHLHRLGDHGEDPHR